MKIEIKNQSVITEAWCELNDVSILFPEVLTVIPEAEDEKLSCLG